MKVNYSSQPVDKSKKSIFLAGPTPRDVNIESWRKEAVRLLEELGFDGIVYVPELKTRRQTYDYNTQVWWEREALFNADLIVFWIPRNMETMPALTTNVEFGYWLSREPNKVLYGRPDNSEKNKYLDWLYQTESKNSCFNSLAELLAKAVEIINTK